MSLPYEQRWNICSRKLKEENYNLRSLEKNKEFVDEMEFRRQITQNEETQKFETEAAELDEANERVVEGFERLEGVVVEAGGANFENYIDKSKANSGHESDESERFESEEHVERNLVGLENIQIPQNQGEKENITQIDFKETIFIENLQLPLGSKLRILLG